MPCPCIVHCCDLRHLSKSSTCPCPADYCFSAVRVTSEGIVSTLTHSRQNAWIIGSWMNINIVIQLSFCCCSWPQNLLNANSPPSSRGPKIVLGRKYNKFLSSPGRTVLIVNVSLMAECLAYVMPSLALYWTDLWLGLIGSEHFWCVSRCSVMHCTANGLRQLPFCMYRILTPLTDITVHHSLQVLCSRNSHRFTLSSF